MLTQANGFKYQVECIISHSNAVVGEIAQYTEPTCGTLTRYKSVVHQDSECDENACVLWTKWSAVSLLCLLYLPLLEARSLFFPWTCFTLRKYVFKRDLRNDGLCTRIQRVEWRSENKVAGTVRKRAVAMRCVAPLECVPCNPICRVTLHLALPSLRKTAERKHAGWRS